MNIHMNEDVNEGKQKLTSHLHFIPPIASITNDKKIEQVADM